MLERKLDQLTISLRGLLGQKINLDAAGKSMVETLIGGGKILAAGNGGSASDAQHFCAELVGRFNRERMALSAICLNTDTSALTAIANDYGYEEVFARQIEGLAQPGDVFLGISTSGTSKSIQRAMAVAQSLNVTTIMLTSEKLNTASGADFEIKVPTTATETAQESHIFIIHYWCQLIDAYFIDGSCP